jgi:hypothetical protein
MLKQVCLWGQETHAIAVGCMQAADPAAQEAPATNTGNSGATDAKQVPELQAALDKALHEKKIISRQLDEVGRLHGYACSSVRTSPSSAHRLNSEPCLSDKQSLCPASYTLVPPHGLPTCNVGLCSHIDSRITSVPGRICHASIDLI